MKHSGNFRALYQTCFLILAITLTLVLTSCSSIPFLSSSNNGQEFKAEGTYLEGCNCANCSSDITGETSDCEFMGAANFTGGKFMQVDLKDARIAFAGKRGSWAHLYVQAANNVQREAVTEFAKRYLSSFARVESTTTATITIEGSNNQYTAKVNDGSIMTLNTQPILGGDNENPVKFQNAKSILNHTYDLGRTVFGSYVDGNHKIEMKNSAAIFNPDMNTNGAFD